MTLPEDTILENRYRIDGLLAHGGMGAIYRGFDTNLSTPVAIKENFFQTPQAINQFKREALILARLRHPTLPRVTHHFDFEGQHYLVMDFIEGENLWEIVKKQRQPLEENRALDYLIQVSKAVSYLHRQKPPIIHRDVKPQNIKITPDDRAILVDFGIAKEGAAGSRTQTGAQGITPGFSPPEQYSGMGTTPASDIYSLGATLYAVLTGKKPPDSVSMMVGGAKFQPPDEINVKLTHQVSQAILQAMQVKPDDRPQSVAVWQSELEDIAKSSTLTSVAGPGQDKEETLVGASASTTSPAPAQQTTTAAPPAFPPASAGPAPPPKRSPLVVVLPVVIAAVILGGAVAAAGYILYTSGVLSFSPATPVTQAGPLSVEAQTQTVEAIEAEVRMTARAETEMTAQAKIDAENTHQAQRDATATSEAGLTETALAESVPADTATPTTAGPTEPSPTTPPTKATTPPKPSSTATPTKVSPKTPAATRASAGPTLVPLKSAGSITQIGTQQVTDVDINLKNPQEVYVLIKGDGLYKSSSGGDSPWARIEVDGSAITAFVIDPHDPATFYAPTWNAVLKSSDGGNTWKPFGSGLTANRVVDVVTVDPENPNLLYAGIGSTLVVSTDGGQNWTSDEFGKGLVAGRMTHIVVDPFNTDVIYVGGLFGSIYKSVDTGRNFITLAYGVGEGTFGMVAHPTKRDVYLVGINAYEAGIIKTENGADFLSVSNGLIFGGADSAYSAIVYAPSNPNIVYAGSGYEDDRFAKGIFKSTDGGQSWEGVNNGLTYNSATGHPHYVKSIAVHPSNPNIIFAATGSGLYKSTNGGESWSLK